MNASTGPDTPVVGCVDGEYERYVALTFRDQVLRAVRAIGLAEAGVQRLRKREQGFRIQFAADDQQLE